MVVFKSLPFVLEYIDVINTGIKETCPGQELSDIQKLWLGFCITCMIVTNSLCWAIFERTSLGGYKAQALSWMFHHAKIPWEILLKISTTAILEEYGIKNGHLVIDDSDRSRSKNTKKLFKVFRTKDKRTGGYIDAQCLVFLVLVTDKITIPVGFDFYMPDPGMKIWKKNDKRLRKKGIKKKDRPPEPPVNPNYPTKQQIACLLCVQFINNFPLVEIKSISADAAFGIKEFLDGMYTLFEGAQIISQIRSNQKVIWKGKRKHVKKVFAGQTPIQTNVVIRGGKEVKIEYLAARLVVCSHDGKKRLIVAMRYEGEEEYRYIVAKDLSWRAIDVITAYSLRWLIEVYFEDWKCYEGWGQLAMQQGDDGACRGVILSVLYDHCLLLHDDQKTRIENKMPACTVGSLREKLAMENLVAAIQQLLSFNDPVKTLKSFMQQIEDVFKLRDSKKHMNGRDLGRFEGTVPLQRKFCRAMK